MKIHEYQAKELLIKYSVAVPNGKAAFSEEEAVSVATQVSKGPWVVKAQIHAGGRGKGGGVKVAKTQEELNSHIKSIWGMTLVTPQTGPQGKKVKRLLIEEGVDIDKEYYLAITLDRATSKLCVIASRAGGMDIEEVAAKSPEKIFNTWIHPSVGLCGFQVRSIAYKLGFSDTASKEFAPLLKNLLLFFTESDCSLVEINPLVVTKQGHLIALDAKVTFDDNGLFRHPTFVELTDHNEEEVSETLAKRFDLSYISLDGEIGCMVNGAGLAMATMDIIKHEGGSPANFLDVGGSASESKVKEAFKIILQDKHVKAILVNIFGGIMKCDLLAAGIVAAAQELALTVPLVVRLEGTNVEQGKKILQKSGLKIISANSMKDAAEKAVKAARGAQ